MNVLEIDESIDDIQKALGFQAQVVYFYDKTLVIKLWQNHVSYFLVLSLQWGQQGVFLIPDEGKFKPRIEKKPIYLFAKSHLIPSTFLDIQRDLNAGRKVELFFANEKEEELKIVINLIPSTMNLELHKGSKSIYLLKPKDQPEMKNVDLSKVQARTLDTLKKPWLEDFGFKTKFSENKKKISEVLPSDSNKESKLVQPKKLTGLELEISKKKKALKKVKADLDEKMKDHFFEFAQLLTFDPIKAKEKFPEFYDERKNIHKLKDLYFEKHKALSAKRNRVEERLRTLKLEIKHLESISEEDWLNTKAQGVKVKPDMKSSMKTRKLEVASDLVAYYGKSAADNMKLLRAAKAWHLWFHIKDLPSAHMILFRDKSRSISDEEIKKASLWLISEVASESKGATVEVLMTECRYVKPIKGDRLGRVNYSQEQTFRFRL